MDITTLNVVIGATITFIGAGILFVLGAIVTYVRAINRSMKELLIMATEHRTRIDVLDRQVEDLYKRLNNKN
jgi:hypothetical protein